MNIFYPIQTENDLSKTTHLAFAAHQDDLELNMFPPIFECYNDANKHFCGVTVTDGGGSPRTGKYNDCSYEQMIQIRLEEQNKAAELGKYSAMIQLGYTSNEVKHDKRDEIISDMREILEKTRPEYIFTHSPFDKHSTHLAVMCCLVEALRQSDYKPKVFHGFEGWRDLDWLNDEDKIPYDVSGSQELSDTLALTFDSQVAGGKRYDLAVIGRRRSNATFGQSHSVDSAEMIVNAVDMMPLLDNPELSVQEFAASHIDAFKASAISELNKLTNK